MQTDFMIRRSGHDMTNFYSEDILVKRPAIVLFGRLGWETANCFDEVFGAGVPAGPGRPYLGCEIPAKGVSRPRLAADVARLHCASIRSQFDRTGKHR